MTGILLRPALLASVSISILMGAGNTAVAQAAPPQPPTATSPLDEITVTATRREEKAVDAMASVSVTNRQEIRTQQPGRIGTVISQVPGVTTQENPNDPATAINIRGLQDFGRVAVTVDGARQNFQRSGHNANGAFYLDPAFIRTIDITRGPVANVYGSGAIGGVVSFETVDPKDILRPGEKFATELGFTGVVGGRLNGIYGHGIGAMRATDWASGLIGLSFRNLNDYKSGSGNTVADSGQELASGIGKIVLTPGDGHTIKLSGQYQKYDFINGVTATTRRSSEVETSNFVAKYAFSQPDNDWLNLNATVYKTTTDTNQVRISNGNPRFFKIATHGFDINNTIRAEAAGIKFNVTYGGDLFEDRVKTWDPFSNGDEFTPRGRRLVYGGFIQNHMKYSIIDVIAALRYDGYQLESATSSSEGQRVSPKITIGITPIQGIQPYVTYAEGYRAPSITETLIAGTHPAPANFILLPNPNLKPETGKTLEAGVNLKYDNVLKAGDAFRGKVSVFENKVQNFIEAVSTPGPLPGFADDTFQYQNIARARLRGIEGEFTYDARTWFASISASHIRGDNLGANQPLESIYPDKIILGGGMRFLDEKLQVGGRVTLVDRQKRLPAASAVLPAKTYALIDLYATYEIVKDTRAFALVDNIGDVNYRRYRDSDRSPGLVTKFGLTTRLGM